MNENIQELIQEALVRKKDIARLIKDKRAERYVCLYESESGITLSAIQNGWQPIGFQLSFTWFDKFLFSSAIDQVESEIKRHQYLLDELKKMQSYEQN